MDFIPPSNIEDFKNIKKEYEFALRKWKKEFEKLSKIVTKDMQALLYIQSVTIDKLAFRTELKILEK